MADRDPAELNPLNTDGGFTPATAGLSPMTAPTAQCNSKSYKLPVEDLDFLLRDEMRAVRFELEYSKAELMLRDWGVRSTVIVFGSARIPSPEQAKALRAAAADLGRAIARLVAAFRPARLLAHDPAGVAPEAEAADWPGLLAASELLILALPLAAATKWVLDAAALARLSAGTRVVNVGRGSVVDEAALIRALREKRILTAALDVFADEPQLPPELLRLPNVVLTPHIGGLSERSIGAMTESATASVLAALAGRPDRSVVANPAVLDAALGVTAGEARA
jgi:hypothetical protein